MPKKPVVRYTDELGDYIYNVICEEGTVKGHFDGSNPELPTWRAIFEWASDPNHPFHEKMKKANTVRVYSFLEDMIMIADDDLDDTVMQPNGRIVFNTANVKRAALKVSARERFIAKILNLNPMSLSSNDVTVQKTDAGIVVVLPHNGRD